MKSKKGATFLNLGIFPGKILFCSGLRHAEIIKFLKRGKHEFWITSIEEDKSLDDVSIVGKTTSFLCREVSDDVTNIKENFCFIIIPDEFTFTDMEYINLAHECLHACQFLLPTFLDRNVEHEAEGYTHSHLMMQCLEFLRKK